MPIIIREEGGGEEREKGGGEKFYYYELLRGKNYLLPFFVALALSVVTCTQ